MDLDTWKGIAYMIAYSAQFQAGQTKEMLDERLPEPIKPDSIFGLIKGTLDRITPDIAKQIVSSFEGATREDLLDLDTWKGVWYMLNYSLQFQAEKCLSPGGAAALQWLVSAWQIWQMPYGPFALVNDFVPVLS